MAVDLTVCIHMLQYNPEKSLSVCHIFPLRWEIKYTLPRFEQPAKWSASATYEGPFCRALSHRACPVEFTSSLPADVDGSLSVGPQWITDIDQSG